MCKFSVKAALNNEKRTLTSCDDGRDRIKVIKRSGGMRSRRYRNKGSIWAGGILDRGIM